MNDQTTTITARSLKTARTHAARAEEFRRIAHEHSGALDRFAQFHATSRVVQHYAKRADHHAAMANYAMDAALTALDAAKAATDAKELKAANRAAARASRRAKDRAIAAYQLLMTAPDALVEEIAAAGH
jgi:hypothetical protein